MKDPHIAIWRNQQPPAGTATASQPAAGQPPAGQPPAGQQFVRFSQQRRWPPAGQPSGVAATRPGCHSRAPLRSQKRARSFPPARGRPTRSLGTPSLLPLTARSDTPALWQLVHLPVSMAGSGAWASRGCLQDFRALKAFGLCGSRTLRAVWICRSKPLKCRTFSREPRNRRGIGARRGLVALNPKPKNPKP
eukprot:365484-Chlamydomonas_euryale.AAC.1